MRKFTFLYSTLALLFIGIFSANAQWQQTGASLTSPVKCLLVNGTTIFAGTDGNGVFISTDNGTTWSGANNGLGTNLNIYALTRLSSGTLLAGTWGGGAFYSTDNGANWSHTALADSGLTARYISAFTVSGSNVFAASAEAGIFRSVNIGVNWTSVNGGLENPYFVSLATSGSYIFAGYYYGGVFVSADNGTTWQNKGLSNTQLYAFAVNGSNIYAGSTTDGMFHSKDNGNAWAAIDSVLTNTKVYAVAGVGTDVLSGTDGNGVFLSKDSGANWIAFSIGGLSSARIRSLGSNSTTLFAATSTGKVWKRTVSDLSNCAPYLKTSGPTTLCQGESVTIVAPVGTAYLWNTGQSTRSILVSKSGIYSSVVTTICGDVLSNNVVVNVKPLPVAAITSPDPLTFCKGDSAHLIASGGGTYLWSNTTHSTSAIITVKVSGVDTVTVTGINGCKSIAVVTVNANAIPLISVQPKNDTVFAGCAARFIARDVTANHPSYQWQVNLGSGYNDINNGIYYSGATKDTLIVKTTTAFMSGFKYRAVLSNGARCLDTSNVATLTVKSQILASRSDTLCLGDSITIGTHTYHISGIYIDTLKAARGCDSLYRTYNVLFSPEKKRSQSVTICNGGTLMVGPFTHNSSGTYTDTIHTMGGCDSIVTTTLTVSSSYLTATERDTLCFGDTVTVGNHQYTKTGAYIDTVRNISGCYTILTTRLVYRALLRTTQTISICKGSSFAVGIHVYDTSGTYIDSLVPIANCDSIVTTKLTVKPPPAGTQTVKICAGETLAVGIHVYDTSGVYKDTLQTLAGCDSILTTNLTVRAPISSSQTFTLCIGDTVTVGTNSYYSTGNYSDTLKSVSGCDSIVTTDLTISTSVTHTQNVAICPHSFYVIGANVYIAEGTYIDTLPAGIGCDSIVTTVLSYLPAITRAQNIAVCQGGSYTLNSHTYTVPGTYVDSIVTLAGCDSVITTNFSITTVNDSITISGSTLSSVMTGATYKWVNCDRRETILGTGHDFLPKVDGDYALIINVSGCIDTSYCVSMSNVAVHAIAQYNSFSIYPNPASSMLNVQPSLQLINKQATVSVLNIIGDLVKSDTRMLEKEFTLDIKDLPKGIYFVQIRSEAGNVVKRFVKE